MRVPVRYTQRMDRVDRLARAVFQTDDLGSVPAAARERLLALAFVALTPDEAQVMDFLYGLRAGLAYDPADVAGQLRKTPEQVLQIEHESLVKLRGVIGRG